MRRSKPNVNDHARPLAWRGHNRAKLLSIVRRKQLQNNRAGQRFHVTGSRVAYRPLGNRGSKRFYVRSFANSSAAAVPRLSPGQTAATGRSELAHLATDLTDGLLLQLADALARQVVLVTDLFERELVFVIETEAPADDAGFDRGQGAE